MQTALDFYRKEITAVFSDTNSKHKTESEIYEQAKEMEKQQIIDAFDEGQEYEYQYHINNAPKFDSQTYFAETYGSKGSDKEEQKKLITEIMNEDAKDGLYNTSSQTEISDEEIEKPSLTKELNVFLRWVIMRYSTITTDGLMFGWVDSMGNEVSAEEIVNHYKASMDELFKDFDEWYREQLKSRQ